MTRREAKGPHLEANPDGVPDTRRVDREGRQGSRERCRVVVVRWLGWRVEVLFSRLARAVVEDDVPEGLSREQILGMRLKLPRVLDLNLSRPYPTALPEASLLLSSLPPLLPSGIAGAKCACRTNASHRTTFMSPSTNPYLLANPNARHASASSEPRRRW